MNNYENSKKARRIASVIYLLIMAVILGGTYLSNQQKELAERYRRSHPVDRNACWFSSTQSRIAEGNTRFFSGCRAVLCLMLMPNC